MTHRGTYVAAMAPAAVVYKRTHRDGQTNNSPVFFELNHPGHHNGPTRADHPLLQSGTYEIALFPNVLDRGRLTNLILPLQLSFYSDRVLIALEEAKAKYTVYPIDFTNKPDWYSKVNPVGKVRSVASISSPVCITSYNAFLHPI